MNTLPGRVPLLFSVLAVAACAGGSGGVADGRGSGISVTPEMLQRGQTIYRQACQQCHGPTGRGDGYAAAALDPKPRNHADPALMDQVSDQRIADTIQQGGIISGYPNMPANPHIQGKDLACLVAFVRSLSRPDVASVHLDAEQ